MDELMRPASYLKDQWGKDSLSYYGFQTWVMDYHGMRCSYMRGMLGQYIIAIPDLDAIVVRLGRKRCDVYNREITTDITRYMDIAMKILKGNDACCRLLVTGAYGTMCECFSIGLLLNHSLFCRAILEILRKFAETVNFISDEEHDLSGRHTEF